MPESISDPVPADRDQLVVAVVGVGTMGRGIARLMLGAGHRVRLHDHQPGVAASWLAGLTSGERARAVEVDSMDTVAVGADLVVEAVAEDRAVKAVVLKTLSATASDECVIASNTSSYPIDGLAVDCSRPERFLGVHFFNPADIIPGVEVIPGEATDDSVVTSVMKWLSAAGKRPAVVRSSPGFIANRLQMALFLECLRCVDEGLVTAEDLDTVVSTTFGFRLPLFGPFAIADMAGLDVYESILETLRGGYGDRFAAPDALTSRTAAGATGMKSGAGFGTYTSEQQTDIVRRRDAGYRRLGEVLHELLPSDASNEEAR